jgi:hypothetical protein
LLFAVHPQFQAEIHEDRGQTVSGDLASVTSHEAEGEIAL